MVTIGDIIAANHVGVEKPIIGRIASEDDVYFYVELEVPISGFWGKFEVGDIVRIFPSNLFRVYRNGVEYYTTGRAIGNPVTRDIDRYF